MKNTTDKNANIEVLSWREAVRKRPAMYTGNTGIQGFVNLLKDFFASFYHYLDISHFPNGSGLRNFDAELFSFEITGKQSGIFRFEKLKTEIPSNINENLFIVGFDFAVLNALSKNYEFMLFDKDQKEIVKQNYQQGILQSGEVDERKYLAEIMQIKFELDESIWEEFVINPVFICDLVKEFAFLNKNKTYEVKYSLKDESCRILYHFENGLKEMIDAEEPKFWGRAVLNTYLEKDFGDFSIETAFAFWDYSINEPFFKSYVNNHYTHEGGTHADAFISGLVKASKKYVKKYRPSERFVISKRTVLSFLLGSIHIKMKRPRFWGATRNKLDSKELVKPLSDYICKIMFENLENDEETAKRIIRHFADIHWDKNWSKHN